MINQTNTSLGSNAGRAPMSATVTDMEYIEGQFMIADKTILARKKV